MEILLLLLTVCTCATALARPWVGVVAYYALALGHPQSIWPWIFQNNRITLYVTLATFCGFLIAVMKKEISFSVLKNRQPVLMGILVVCVNLSNIFSPIQIGSIQGAMGPDALTSIFNKVVLFYFVAVLIIDNRYKFMSLLYVMPAVALYYTYWANSVFLSGERRWFGDNGRLGGPGGMFADENDFAFLFVAGMPMIYYIALANKNLIIKVLLLLSIPWLWHAIFLTGSRGGLLALGVVSLYIAYRSPSKIFGILLFVGLLVAVTYQGGIIVNRVDSTVEKQQGLEGEEPLDPRLISWGVGLKIMRDYPLLGVGVGKFQYVFPIYSPDHEPHVAHNTFLQFGSNSGIPAGLIYLSFFVIVYRQDRYEKKHIHHKLGSGIDLYSRDLINASMLGCLVCGFFLSLMVFELMYYLLILVLSRSVFVNQQISQDEQQ